MGCGGSSAAIKQPPVVELEKDNVDIKGKLNPSQTSAPTMEESNSVDAGNTVSDSFHSQTAVEEISKAVSVEQQPISSVEAEFYPVLKTDDHKTDNEAEYFPNPVAHPHPVVVCDAINGDSDSNNLIHHDNKPETSEIHPAVLQVPTFNETKVTVNHGEEQCRDHQDKGTPNTNTEAKAQGLSEIAPAVPVITSTASAVAAATTSATAAAPTAITTTAIPAEEETPVAAPLITMGFLLKQGHVIRNWKLRFVVVDCGVIRYYEQKAVYPPYGVKQKGVFELKRCTVAKMSDGKFIITSPNDTLLLENKDQTLGATDIWVENIRRHIDYANRITKQ